MIEGEDGGRLHLRGIDMMPGGIGGPCGPLFRYRRPAAVAPSPVLAKPVTM